MSVSWGENLSTTAATEAWRRCLRPRRSPAEGIVFDEPRDVGQDSQVDAGHPPWRKHQEEDVAGLEVQGLEIDPVQTAPNEQNDARKRRKFAVWYGDAVANASGAETLPVQKDREGRDRRQDGDAWPQWRWSSPEALRTWWWPEGLEAPGSGRGTRQDASLFPGSMRPKSPFFVR